MTVYEFEKRVSTVALFDGLQEATFASVVEQVTSSAEGETPEWARVTTSADLDAGQQSELDGIVDAHDPAAPSVDQVIGSAQEFGRSLILKWQRRIMLDGVVQAGQAHAVAIALSTAGVMAHLGNLYALDAELAQVTPIDTFLDADRIVDIRNEIRDYLGLENV